MALRHSTFVSQVLVINKTNVYVGETRPSDPPPTMVDDATGVKLVMSGCRYVRRYAFVGGRGTTTTDKLLGDECFRNTPGDVVLTLTNVRLPMQCPRTAVLHNTHLYII